MKKPSTNSSDATTTEMNDTKSSTKSRKPRGFNSKHKRSFKSDREDPKKGMKMRGANDITWYAQSPDLLRDTASFPWSTQSGLTYPMSTQYGPSNLAVRNFTAPGILVAYTGLGIGNTDQQLDAVNIAANAIYTYVRHMNSGHSNYDAPDLMMYLLAMDQVYACINWLQRLLGTVSSFNVHSRYTPKALIEAQGVDYEDLKSNQVWLRAQLNTLILQAATLVVPNSMPVYARHAWMFSKYYIEGDDMKDQIYMYSPCYFLKLNIPAGGGPGTLSRVDVKADGSTRYTIPTASDTARLYAVDLVHILYQLIQTMYMSEDFGIMAGDILKAYGESGVMRLTTFPEAYITPIEHNDEVLLQFKNSNALRASWKGVYVDAYAPGGFGDIIQDPNTNVISQNMVHSITDPVDYFDDFSRTLMLTLSGSPSPEMNMIMTRCQSWAKVIPVDTTSEVMCGTEYIANYQIIADIDPWTVFGFSTYNTLFDSATDQLKFTTYIWYASTVAFKYMPALNLARSDNGGTIQDNQIVQQWQVDNFAIYDNTILDRMNAVAIMSEFNVPHMALITK